MNKKEKELFLQLCKFRDPDKKKIENLLENGSATYEVLGMLFANRMAGVAYDVLNKTELLDKTGREFRNSIRNAAWLNEKINEDYIGCINFLFAELEETGLSYAFLKGAYLCHWYPKGARTSNDIDILVTPNDVGKVSTKLKIAGFNQGYLKNGVFVPASRQEIIESKLTRGETVPFIKETRMPYMKHIEVDLNFSLDYKNNDDKALKKMLERARVVEVASAKIRTLDKIDFLLHLCAHLYKEATTMPWIRMNRDMTFYKYCDIYAMLYDFSDEEIQILIERAIEEGISKEVAYCLYSIDAFFNTRYFCTIPKEDLEIVISPSEKKIYRYKETDPVKRFFSPNRLTMLEEVNV